MAKGKQTICFIGKFNKIYDEEYIARSFESLGHSVVRIADSLLTNQILDLIEHYSPNFVLFTKLNTTEPIKIIEYCKKNNIKTVAWIFDLYWGYHREYRIKSQACFKADIVVTTDGGHDKEWKSVGINHKCIRQGIFKEECILYRFNQTENEVVFVGSNNPVYPERYEMMSNLSKEFKFKWLGKNNTNEIRSLQLNDLYSRTKVVVGDSFYSPKYWSNRIVETLGRGGFLIHQEVEGLKEEYPYLVTYKRGDLDDLKTKIKYYLSHEDERRDIIEKNFEWVLDNYTMDKKCKELIKII